MNRLLGIFSRWFPSLFRFLKAPGNQLAAAETVTHEPVAELSANDVSRPVTSAAKKLAVSSASPSAGLKGALSASPIVSKLPESPKKSVTSAATSLVTKSSTASMATATAKTVQVVRAHVPLIRFRHRPGAQSSSVAVNSGVQQTNVDAVSNKPQIGMTPRGSGIDEAFLPYGFRRKALDPSEIEAINMGGRY